MPTQANTPDRTAESSANEVLLDIFLARQLWLIRSGNHEALLARKWLREEQADLLGQLQAKLFRLAQEGVVLTPTTNRRLKELEEALRLASDDMTTRLLSDSIGRLRLLAQQEAELTKEVIEREATGAVAVSLPAAALLSALLRDQPFDGLTLSEWYEKLSQMQQQEVLRVIRIGLTQGESVEQITRRLRGTRASNYQDGVFGRVEDGAQAIAASAVIFAAMVARQQVMADNAQFFRGLMWSSTFDAKTCLRCASLDGRVFPLDRGPRPALHPRCRCAVSPVLLASLGGRAPTRLTYNQWLHRQVEAGRLGLVEEALGKTRAKAFASGQLQVTDFVNREGRILPLRELGLRNR